jgi:hypothetical protein
MIKGDVEEKTGCSRAEKCFKKTVQDNVNGSRIFW